MFKRLRKAASNIFKKITSFFKPKAKAQKQHGNLPIVDDFGFIESEDELSELPTVDNELKPKTLPGNGANYRSPFPVPDDTIKNAVESGNWYYTESKPAFTNKLNLWYATMTDAIGIIASHKMSQNSYDTWFSKSIPLTDDDMMEINAIIFRTDALDYLDWYENNGGRIISNNIDYALAASDTTVVYHYNEQISALLRNLLY